MKNDEKILQDPAEAGQLGRRIRLTPLTLTSDPFLFRRIVTESDAFVTKVKPGMIWMSFHHASTPTNELTVHAFDPISQTGEYKICAVQLEKMA
jgi:hypothetical protein